MTARWLRTERDRLLDFGTGLAHPRGGAAWLAADGRPDPDRPLATWITARMTHVYAVGAALGRPGDAAVAAAALAPDGTPSPGRSAYAHAFVLLGACSAAAVGLPGGDGLLAAAVPAFRRFRDDAGLLADELDTRWRAAPYRGLNALMHGVEAMLAAWDHTGDAAWRDWAHHAARFTADLVTAHGHRLPNTSTPRGRRSRSTTRTVRTPRSSRTAPPSATRWKTHRRRPLRRRPAPLVDDRAPPRRRPDGSWHHQLAPDLTPADSVWPGSPDLYHALTALLMPSLPLGVGTTAAVRSAARRRLR